MIKNALYSAAATAVLLIAGTQSGVAREFADIYTECGLGAMIAPKNSAVAAVTNVTWDLGTTAISSNISSPDSCKGGQDKKAAFIHDTYPHLEKDLARGEGKHLKTLLAIAGCNARAHGDVARALRQDFGEMVTKSGYTTQSRYEQAKGLYERFNQRIESDFAQSCSVG